MHIMYVWNISNQRIRANAIEQTEKTLSAIGIQGGSCQLRKDNKRNGALGNVPHKPSISGAVANRLFQSSSRSGNDKVWKDVFQAENSNTGKGTDCIAKATMWQAFEELQLYITELVLTATQQSEFKERIQNWGRAFVNAFEKEQIFHYMVSTMFPNLMLHASREEAQSTYLLSVTMLLVP